MPADKLSSQSSPCALSEGCPTCRKGPDLAGENRFWFHEALRVGWNSKVKLRRNGRQGCKPEGVEQQHEDTTPGRRDPAGSILRLAGRSGASACGGLKTIMRMPRGKKQIVRRARFQPLAPRIARRSVRARRPLVSACQSLGLRWGACREEPSHPAGTQAMQAASQTPGRNGTQ